MEAEAVATGRSGCGLGTAGDGGIVKCKTFSLSTELTKNTGSLLEIESIAPGATTGCERSPYDTWVTNPMLLDLTLPTEGEHVGTAEMNFGIYVPLWDFECPFTGELQGPYCGGTVENFKGDFALSTTEAGGAVILD